MKITPFDRAFGIGACAVLFVAQLAAAGLPRERLLLDADWKFHLGHATALRAVNYCVDCR